VHVRGHQGLRARLPLDELGLRFGVPRSRVRDGWWERGGGGGGGGAVRTEAASLWAQDRGAHGSPARRRSAALQQRGGGDKEGARLPQAFPGIHRLARHI
jgi:hypothetical protein